MHQSVGRSLHYAGRFEEAVRHLQRVFDIEPGFVAAYETIVRPLCALGRFEEAEGYALEGISRAGQVDAPAGSAGLHLWGGSGKRTARAIVAEIEELSTQRFVPRYHVAMVYYGLRDEAAALREIERCVAERSGVLSWVTFDPHTAWLQSSPGSGSWCGSFNHGESWEGDSG